MDPRPYHFQYRRPRLHNPTYQSLKLYESIYQNQGWRNGGNGSNGNSKGMWENIQNVERSGIQGKRHADNYNTGKQRATPQSQPVPKPSSPSSIKRYQSSDINPKSLTKLSTRYAPQPRAHTPKKSIESTQRELNSSLSQYGTNVINYLNTVQLMDQNRVYMKQEKQFDIINYQPKGYQPRLKNYPRLTLEDRIMERRGPEGLK